MFRKITQHVGDSGAGLARAAKEVRVVAVGKDLAAPLHDPVEPPGHPHGKPLHPASETDLVNCLDDEMQVIALHREVDEPEAAPLPPTRKGATEGPEAPAAAQIPDLGPDAQGDMHRKPRRQLLARVVRHARARLATRMSARASPAAQAEPKRKLL